MISEKEIDHSAATLPSVDAADVGGKLARVASLARELGSERVGEEAVGLAGRLAEGRFYVACLGQFKRGKSTLLNALVGNAALPTGVTPITTVPTVLRYGKKRSARVRYEGGSWTPIGPEELMQYVSEEHNPENAKGIAGVEVFDPSPLLADGMCLVDTPGLGSVFAGNTAATQAFVPQIDAAIVVLGADPPIAGQELDLIEAVGKQIRQFVVVLNKADRTSDAERQIAASFTRSVIEKRLGRSAGPIYEISAFEKLEKHQRNWDWDALVARLEELARESGRTLVRAAGERGLRALCEELLAVIAEEREALIRPIEESEQRIVAMRRTITESEQSLRDLGYLFMAEQHRLSDLFLAQRKSFLAAAFPKATLEFSEELRAIPTRYGPRFRRMAMRAAQRTAERHVMPWLAAEQERAEGEYGEVEARFVRLGNDFLKKLSESGVPELARMPNALDSERGFRVPSGFTFEGLIHVAEPPSPIRYVADVVLGLLRAFFIIEKDAQIFFAYLLEMNSTRVQSDAVSRLQASKEQLEAEIRKLLHEVSRIAERALIHARAAQAQGAPAVEDKLASLNVAEAEIRTVVGSGRERRCR